MEWKTGFDALKLLDSVNDFSTKDDIVKDVFINGHVQPRIKKKSKREGFINPRTGSPVNNELDNVNTDDDECTEPLGRSVFKYDNTKLPQQLRKVRNAICDEDVARYFTQDSNNNPTKYPVNAGDDDVIIISEDHESYFIPKLTTLMKVQEDVVVSCRNGSVVPGQRVHHDEDRPGQPVSTTTGSILPPSRPTVTAVRSKMARNAIMDLLLAKNTHLDLQNRKEEVVEKEEAMNVAVVIKNSEPSSLYVPPHRRKKQMKNETEDLMMTQQEPATINTCPPPNNVANIDYISNNDSDGFKKALIANFDNPNFSFTSIQTPHKKNNIKPDLNEKLLFKKLNLDSCAEEECRKPRSREKYVELARNIGKNSFFGMSTDVKHADSMSFGNLLSLGDSSNERSTKNESNFSFNICEFPQFSPKSKKC